MNNHRGGTNGESSCSSSQSSVDFDEINQMLSEFEPKLKIARKSSGASGEDEDDDLQTLEMQVAQIKAGPATRTRRNQHSGSESKITRTRNRKKEEQSTTNGFVGKPLKDCSRVLPPSVLRNEEGPQLQELIQLDTMQNFTLVNELLDDGHGYVREIEDEDEYATDVARTVPSDGLRALSLDQLPLICSEIERFHLFKMFTHYNHSNDQGHLVQCSYCRCTMTKVESRIHAVCHYPIGRLRCALCDCVTVHSDHMRNHILQRGCARLHMAPVDMIRPGVPCMSPEQADLFIFILNEARPGALMFTTGKIVDEHTYRSTDPDPTFLQYLMQDWMITDRPPTYTAKVYT